jgi:hypothetical protein
VIPLHPVLFALAPILSVYGYNSRRVAIVPGELVLPVLFAIAVTTLIWLALGLVLRSGARAALIVSLLVLLTFLYGHAARLLGAPRIRHELLLAVWLLLFAAGTWLALRLRQALAGSTAVLNVMAAVGLLVSLAGALPALFRAAGDTAVVRRERAAAPEHLPDIYYIVLDAYGRADILERTYHLDNSEFLGFLRSAEFRVADRSRSNYAQTYLSLASSLNLGYLDSIVGSEGRRSGRSVPLIRMIENNLVADFLRRRGYAIITFSSGYTGTTLEGADLTLEPRRSLSEFHDMLLSTTLLPVVLAPLIRHSPDDLHRERILFSFRSIPKAARGRHPAFVFAHIVSPHPPFVFGARGERPKITPYLRIDQTGTMQSISKTLVRQWYIDNYGPQVRYLNTLIRDMVERILREAPRPPVIILQGDHGPGSILNWDEPELNQLPERHAILNALYLPPDLRGRLEAAGGFPDSVTPVNTFRILLRQLFDTAFAMLPDKSYFSTLARPYELYDIDRPESYPQAARLGEPDGAVNVVAFPAASRAPENAAVYSRRLVNLKYPGIRKQISSAHVLPVQGRFSPEQAFGQYRKMVSEGRLPDLGERFEAYSGRGPERDSVTALFFPADD